MTTHVGLVRKLMLAALASGTLNAQSPERQIAFRLPGMESVVRQQNLIYRSLNAIPDTLAYGTALRYDVYLPPREGTATRPGVVFVHGGIVAGTRNERPKDWPAYQQWGRLAAAAGVVGITFTHRLTTEDNVDVASGDVEELLATIRRRASEYGLDPDRLCVAVFSAGGPLATLFLREPRPYVRCLVLYYPYLDMAHSAMHTPFRPPHARSRVEELAAFSPTRWVLANAGRIPPIFLARAGRDAIPGINASIDRFLFAALLAEAPLDFYIHPTGPHGFDRPAGEDDRAAEIVEASIAFLRRHLRQR